MAYYEPVMGGIHIRVVLNMFTDGKGFMWHAAVKATFTIGTQPVAANAR